MADEKGLCLPLMEELTPLNQTLISPELATAFFISSHRNPIPPSSFHHQSSSSPFYSFLPVAATIQDRGSSVTIDTQPADSLRHGGISFGPFASIPGGRSDPEPTLQQELVDLNRQTEAGFIPPMMNDLKAESSYGGGGGGVSDSSNGGSGHAKRGRTNEEGGRAESEDGDSAGGPETSGEDPAARTLKRPRLVWTPQLHKRFVDAVAHLGIKHAVPKTIMQLMNVEGLTRENVASHLQKYRLYLKRMQGLTSDGPSASDQLFASTPIPPALASSPAFLPGHREDLVAIPFVPPIFPPLTPAHMEAALAYGGFDHHPYAAIMRANTNLFAAQEHIVLGMESQAPSTSPRRPILTLFPTSSH